MQRSIFVFKGQQVSRKKEEIFKLDNTITWYLKDYEGDVQKQRKIIERNNGELFYIFKPIEEVKDGRTLGEG